MRVGQVVGHAATVVLLQLPWLLWTPVVARRVRTVAFPIIDKVTVLCTAAKLFRNGLEVGAYLAAGAAKVVQVKHVEEKALVAVAKSHVPRILSIHGRVTHALS